MWTTEHSIETTSSPESIWRLWSDVATWREWNADIERIEILGPFAAGSTIAMTPAGQDTVELRIAEASEPELFVDQADLGEVGRHHHPSDRPPGRPAQHRHLPDGDQRPGGGHRRPGARPPDQRRLPGCPEGAGRAGCDVGSEAG